MRAARLALAGAAALVLVAGSGILGYRAGRSGAAPVREPLRLVVALPEGQALVTGRGSALAFSPDGRRIVYAGAADGVTRLYVRALEALQPTPLAGTEGADAPFFSPDGGWIAFFAGGMLKKIPAAGGAVTTVCAARDGRGGAWAPDDTIVFCPDGSSGLSRVSAAGGEPRPFTRPDRSRGERSHRWPFVIPGRGSVVFTVGPSSAMSYDQSPLAVASLDSGAVTRLSEMGFAARVAGGRLLLVRGATVFAAPFDVRRGLTTGPAAPILEDVRTNASGAAHLAVTDSGSLAYITGGSLETRRTLVWVTAEGKEEAVLDALLDYLHPQLSRDGRKVAVAVRKDGRPDVWIYDLARATLTRLTSGEGSRASPVWSPDGRHVAYVTSVPGGNSGIFWKAVDGSSAEEGLVRLDAAPFGLSFSNDGRTLLYVLRKDQHSDILALDLATRETRPIIATEAEEWSPEISPDGRWLAYTSSESGRPEVYVQPFPGPGGRWQVSNQGGDFPVWARDGRALFYRGNRSMMAVDLAPGAAFRPGLPRALTADRYLSAFYDVAPDRRFLLVRSAADSAPPATTFNLELNVGPPVGGGPGAP